jgi:type IV pilus assembly protein PilY1
MKIFRLFICCLTLTMLASSPLTHAEDIDLYSDNAGTSGLPNVLLVLDNGANFSSTASNCTFVNDGTAGGLVPSLNGTAGGIEQCAIYNVVAGLPADSVNLGLMVYNSNNIRDINNANCSSSNGGCLVQPLVNMSGAAKTKFLAWVKTWKTTGGSGDGYIKASGDAIAATMQEAWAYFDGNTGLSGRSYAGIQPTAGCQKNFVIYIGNAFTVNGTPGDTGNASPSSALAAAPGVTTDLLQKITIPSGAYGTSAFSCGSYSMGTHNDGSGLYADEWARYMYQTDLYNSLDAKQSITTYAVGLLGSSCKPDYPALLSSMAKVGGGKYFATSSYDEISTAILKILNEIQAVNSVFSSASLPVSVNAQGTYLNQIFLGMFRPDASANPRWIGNLKQYQFILEYPDPSNPDPNKATLKLGDSAGNAAISSAGTGFITPGAISFWTQKNSATAPDSTGGFFTNNPMGTGLAFDSPDGELVEKGGAAQQLRLSNLTVNYSSTPSSPRRLYTYCPSGTCNTSLTNSVNAFATTNSLITDAMLSSTSGLSVSSITRTGTTATVTTGSSHGFVTGDTVTISGANQSEYNGVKTLIIVPASSTTTFTFTVAEYPPTPASGTFTASISGSPQTLGSSALTRSGTLASVSLSGHGFVTGQTVTITGAVQGAYNGSHIITKVDSDHFTFTVVEGPVTPAGSGTAKVGASTKNIEAYNSNPKPGVVRVGTTFTVTTTANHGFSNGNTVTIAGVVDPATNGAISEYNITGTVANKSNKSFDLTIAAVTPASPATTLTSIKADGSASAKDITLTRPSGTTVIATSPAHGFVNGQTVSIGGTAGTNEGGYIGSFVISGATTDTFNYSVVTTPVSPATGTITAAKSGTSDRSSLINWVRGEDNYGDEASPGSGYTVRPSIHGDVLHSRPVAINFGTDASPQVVVFYGGNDGVFRAVNGNQTGSMTSGTASVPPGGELWGLVLPEHYSKLNRQRINSPELKLPSTALASAQPKDYFVDGSPGVYQKLKADGTVDKAYLYLTMRRGGRFLYALDVSDPADPKVMWKISNTDTGFSELGQTWSRPRVTLVKGYANPVLVFAGGYDPAEDAEPPTADTMGRGIFVVDAVTGIRVWNAAYTASTTACTGSTTQAACAVSGMNWAMPADISFIDRDNDGKTDRFYASDLGGNVWRVDLEPTAGNTPEKWQVTKFATLGCATGSCTIGTTPRKFFFPPNVVSVGATGASSSYDVVLLGSGDREHPLKSTTSGSSYNVENRFYALKDMNTGMNAGSTPITEAALFNATSVAYDKTLSGFYTSFATGEKSVNASTTLRGTTFFGTNKPTPPSTTSCSSNLGEAKGYALNPFSGTLTSTVYEGGGLPPSPTSGIVTIKLPDGSSIKKEFSVSCGGGGGGGGGVGGECNSALEVCNPPSSVPKSPRRTYWYKK